MTSWQQQKHRDELGKRRAEEESTRDPELEQCFIAYYAFRVEGGQSKFADFQRDWLRQRATHAS